MSLVANAAEIPKGAHVLLRMVNAVSTRTAKVGDYVYLRTASPITVNGRIVVPVESYAQGMVAYTKRGGRVTGKATLAIRLETLMLPDGTVVKFSPRLNAVDSNETGQTVEPPENTIQQGSESGQDAAKVAILAGSGAAIGGLADRGWQGAGIGAGVGSAVGLATVLLGRGREVELRQGMTLDVLFERPLTIE